MSASSPQDQRPGPDQGADQVPAIFGAAQESNRGGFPWKPLLVAALVLLLALAVLIRLGWRSRPSPQFSGAELAPPAAYASSLPLSDIKMSEADSFAGNKATYVDGTITNTGDKTVTGASIQVVFQDDLKQMAQKDVVPVAVIRMHEPYVDTVPLEKSPLKPGQSAEFRLIFDHVSAMWNQQYPQLTVVQAQTE